MFMGIIGWIVMGLVAGYAANSLAKRHGEGLPMDIGLGMVGSVMSGWLFNTFGPAGVTGPNAWNLLVSGIGAVLLLAVGYAIRRPAFHG